jgi:hypothetical protein
MPPSNTPARATPSDYDEKVEELLEWIRQWYGGEFDAPQPDHPLCRMAEAIRAARPAGETMNVYRSAWYAILNESRRKSEEIEELKAQVGALVEAAENAVLQIEYLELKLGHTTGTGAAAKARLRSSIAALRASRSGERRVEGIAHLNPNGDVIGVTVGGTREENEKACRELNPSHFERSAPCTIIWNAAAREEESDAKLES